MFPSILVHQTIALNKSSLNLSATFWETGTLPREGRDYGDGGFARVVMSERNRDSSPATVDLPATEIGIRNASEYVQYSLCTIPSATRLKESSSSAGASSKTSPEAGRSCQVCDRIKPLELGCLGSTQPVPYFVRSIKMEPAIQDPTVECDRAMRIEAY
jgi:hypothetical protein